MENDSVDMLKAHGLRVTLPRQSVLNVFAGQSKALSYNELKDTLPDAFDRVTIYRTLKSFEENGLIHTIADLDGEVSYALCQHNHHSGNCKSLNHAHGHFKCTICGQLFCLENQSLNGLQAPEGYKVESVHLLLRGICTKCQ